MDPFKPYRAQRDAQEATAEAARRDLGPSLDRFEEDLKKLRVEYERFFAGAEQVPPEAAQEKLATRLRMMRQRQGLSSVERFRLSGLEARFTTYSELFKRRTREQEEGRRRHEAAAQQPAYDVEQGVVLGRQLESSAVEALYQGLCRGPKAPRFDLDTFGKYLERQAEALRQKTGCDQVRFRLYDDQGRVRLKAKPIAT